MGVHVVLLPWISQGHLTPVIQLGAILASQQGFKTTLVLSSRTHARLEGAGSPFLHQPNIHIEVIDDGLNPDPAVTPSFEDITTKAIPLMQQNLEALLSALMASPSPVTCLISGTFSSWSKSVACTLGIPRAELWSSPAYIYCAGFYYQRMVSAGVLPLKGEKKDVWITCIPGLPPVRASDFIQDFLVTEEEAQADKEKFSRLSQMTSRMYGSARDQYRILVNTVFELDSQALNALCADGVAACAIGPLFLQSVINTDGTEKPLTQPRTIMYKEDRTCLQWLDGKEDASTLYIAFGSEARMSRDEVQELAYGLESSEQTFLWVIRPGSIVDNEISVEDVLPQGFQERHAERGCIVSWAPQTEVLAHPAIAGFMSHCGWNSTLETLWLGVPVLAWPQRADQGINKKFLEEEWKVGIAIERHEGKVTGASVEKAIRMLMQGEEGARAREKVKGYKDVFCKALQQGGSSRENLNQFIHDLRCLSEKREGQRSGSDQGSAIS